MSAPRNLEIPQYLMKELTSVKEEVCKTQEATDELVDKYFEKIDDKNPELAIRINRLSFASKVLDINLRHLEDTIKTLDLQDPTISATFSRGVFELHLILLEACSDNSSFFNLLVKSNRSYEKYLELYLHMAEIAGNQAAVNQFLLELQRAAISAKTSEKLMAASLKPGLKTKPYYKFDELAKKHGFNDHYEIEYALFSFFIHPSLLNIITTISKDKTMSEGARQNAAYNVAHRKHIVKVMATKFIIEFSKKIVSRIKQLNDECAINPTERNKTCGKL